MNYTETRPWGSFENILDQEDVKVKKITINPSQAPSYQYHYQRDEVWQIVSGTGALRVEGLARIDSRIIEPASGEHKISVHAGTTIWIPAETKHQIENIGTEPLVFIEIQTGEYFGEDDIVRLEDRYGRE